MHQIKFINRILCLLSLLVGLLPVCLIQAQQPQLLKDIYPGPGPSFPYGYTAYDGRVFFVADDGVHGWELWVSDGTEAGTYLFKDINPGPDGSDSSDFTIYNNKLYFRANDGVHEQELWVTDGTQAGTFMVKDINTSGNSDYYPPRQFTEYDGRLFFRAQDGIHGYELWVTDGTDVGTYMVKDINPGPDESNPLDFTEYNGKLYFRADDGTHGQELWVTDGTEAGTQMVKDIHPGPSDSYLSARFAEYNGKLYFRASDGVHGTELWVTDGTETGTYMVKDIYPGPLGGCGTEFVELNGKLYFKGYVVSENNFDLWMTDGTEAGTQPVGIEDLISFQWLFKYDNKIYFNGRHPNHGWVLWATDGTAAGTVVFAQASFPSYFTILDDKLYFISNRKHIWVTDGTHADTYALLPPGADMPVGDPSVQTHGLALANGVLYYSACYYLAVGCEPYFIDHSLSINTFEKGTVSYWPNPFTVKLHIETTEPIEKVNIYNVKGQKLVSTAISTTRESLDLSHLPAGIYFMEVHTKNGRETIKLVKKP